MKTKINTIAAIVTDSIVVAPSVGASIANLDKAREAVANVASKTGEVIGTYAGALCLAFNLVDNAGVVTTPWYELKGKLCEAVKSERAKFVDVMAFRGHGTAVIDTYWARVKDASGRVKAISKVTGAVDVDAATVKDLKAILNRIGNAERDNAPLSFKIVALLISAADLIGINVEAYGLDA